MEELKMEKIAKYDYIYRAIHWSMRPIFFNLVLQKYVQMDPGLKVS